MLYKKIGILFLYYSFLRSGDFFENIFFDMKADSKQAFSFSSINYESILEMLKKYSIKGLSSDAKFIKINQLIKVLDYFDLGAVQVFKAQGRTTDFKAVQALSCKIKKNKYSYWFLDLESFFAQYAKRLALVKNAFIAIQDGKDLFGKIACAQPYVLPSLKEPVESIDKDLAIKKKLAQEKNKKVFDEVVQKYQENIQKINSEIKIDKETITALKNKIQTIENDTRDWESDLLLVKKIDEDSQNVALKQQQLQSDFALNTEEIRKQKDALRVQLNKLRNEKSNYEQIQAKSTEVESLIDRIKDFNEKIDKKGWFFIEPSEIRTERSNILNAVNQLQIPNMEKTETLDSKSRFATDYINLLIDNKDNLYTDKHINVIDTEIKNLQEQSNKLSAQEKILEEQLQEDIKAAQANLNQYTDQFKHNKELHRNSNETQFINDKININNQEIDKLKKLILSSTKKINDQNEHIVFTKEAIRLTNKRWPELIKKTESKSQIEKNQRLKDISYVEYAQTYLDSIFLKEEKPGAVTGALLLYVAQAVDIILYNLELIYAIPLLKKDISMASLQSDYTEKLGLLDTLKYKAADVQQEAGDRFNAFKKALAQVTSKQQPTTSVQKEKKGAQQEDMYCVFDDGLVDNIHAKTVALKEDVQAMLNHTLTLAQLVAKDDYKKLMAIKDLLFVPLCKAYERLERITNPWLEGYGNESFNLKSLKEAYSRLIRSSEKLSSAMIDHKETLIIAEYFFMQVGKDLLQRIQSITINSVEKNKDQWFEDILKTIRAYECALKSIESTQLRWYNFSKDVAIKIKKDFTNLKQRLLEKKIDLALTLTPQLSLLENDQKDIFLNKTNNIDGRLIQAIKNSTLISQFFIQLTTLFRQNAVLKNNISNLDTLKEKISVISSHIKNHENNLQNTLFDQIMKKVYKKLENETNMLLNQVFNNKKL